MNAQSSCRIIRFSGYFEREYIQPFTPGVCHPWDMTERVPAQDPIPAHSDLQQGCITENLILWKYLKNDNKMLLIVNWYRPWQIAKKYIYTQKKGGGKKSCHCTQVYMWARSTSHTPKCHHSSKPHALILGHVQAASHPHPMSYISITNMCSWVSWAGPVQVILYCVWVAKNTHI